MTWLARRGRREPAGVERLTVSYLATVLALLVGGLAALVASPIVNATGLCADDPTDGFCRAFAIGGVASVGAWAGLFLTGWLFALGGAWAAWIVLIDLVGFELVLETNQVWLVLVAVVAPAAAAVLTAPGPAEPPRTAWAGRVKLAAGLVLALQFVVWAVVLVAGA
jgi:hypothetical protein